MAPKICAIVAALLLNITSIQQSLYVTVAQVHDGFPVSTLKRACLTAVILCTSSELATKQVNVGKAFVKGRASWGMYPPSMEVAHLHCPIMRSGVHVYSSCTPDAVCTRVPLLL